VDEQERDDGDGEHQPGVSDHAAQARERKSAKDHFLRDAGVTAPKMRNNLSSVLTGAMKIVRERFGSSPS